MKHPLLIGAQDPVVSADTHTEVRLVTQQTHVWYLELYAKNHGDTGPCVRDYSLSLGKTFFLTDTV